MPRHVPPYRNQRIRELYNILIANKHPRMLTYARIATLYHLSEERVRQIVHRYQRPPNKQKKYNKMT